MLKDFREFALKGNMIDLAIGIIIGAAFSGLVQSMVKDIIMPVVGLLTGGVDFTNKFVSLSSAVTSASLETAREQGPVVAYGNFLTLTINFLIVSAVLFLIVKAVNQLRRPHKPSETPVVSAQEKLLAEIRDLIATQTAEMRNVDARREPDRFGSFGDGT